MRLTSDLAVTQPLRPITGPGFCGADDLVRLEAVVLKNGERIVLSPAAILRCPMAEAVAHWVRDDVAPAVATLGSSARKIATATSYECRERDRVPGAKLSEHGHANALDLDGLTLANGTIVDLTDKTASKEFRERVRQSACNARSPPCWDPALTIFTRPTYTSICSTTRQLSDMPMGCHNAAGDGECAIPEHSSHRSTEIKTAPSPRARPARARITISDRGTRGRTIMSGYRATSPLARIEAKEPKSHPEPTSGQYQAAPGFDHFRNGLFGVRPTAGTRAV